MLRFVFTDIYDKELIAYPLSVTINMEEGVPADDLTATFCYFESDELKGVKVYDESEVVFTGVVDEQITSSFERGDILKINARSMAAVLLDNESVPVSYNHPSTSVIESRHIKPFGIRASEELSDTYFGTHTVLKGESNYKAVESFCKKVYNTTPRINNSGEFCFDGVNKGENVVFSNDGKGIDYCEFSENIKRCEPISKVRIKVVNSSGYHSVVENEDAIKRGIVRERYLNAVLTDTPAIYAQSMIKNSNKKAYCVTLLCKGQHVGAFGCNAVIKDSIKGELDNLYVSAVRYQINNDKEVTTITLKRKDI